MPSNYSDLLDALLVLAGIVLVVTGLVMFIRSKSSTDASSVEAFGIKLNVTHPSLILVLAGVGLMLAPRLLPELPGKPANQPEPAIVAEAPVAPSATLPPAPTALPPPASVALPPEQPAAQAPASTASKPTAGATRPSAQPAAIINRTTPAPQTRLPAPVAPSAPTPQPVVTPVPAKPVVSRPPPVEPKSARPLIAYAGLGLPGNRDFWESETRTSYTRRLHASLQQAGRDVLHMDTKKLDMDEAAFDAWWNEPAQHPRSRALCAAAYAPRALLAALVEPPTTSSANESAYWPVFKIRLYNCANQRVYRQHKTLSPLNSDAWPFSTELNSEVERFMRTYRADLVE
ncbi:MAG TPA: hypothetical protein VIN38_11615 [Thiobacillus sp.]